MRQRCNPCSCWLFPWGLFEVFKDLGVGRRGVINLVASTTFGIYLIHDNCFVRKWLWPHFTWVYSLPFPRFVAACFLVVLGVFLACSALELIRQLVVGAIVPRLPLGGLRKFYGEVDEWMHVGGRSDWSWFLFMGMAGVLPRVFSLAPPGCLMCSACRNPVLVRAGRRVLNRCIVYGIRRATAPKGRSTFLLGTGT